MDVVGDVLDDLVDGGLGVVRIGDGGGAGSHGGREAADAGAAFGAGAAVVGAVETFEQVGQVSGVNARAGVEFLNSLTNKQ